MTGPLADLRQAVVAASGAVAATTGILGESWIFQGVVSTLLLAGVGLGITLLFVAPRFLRRVARDVFGW